MNNKNMFWIGFYFGQNIILHPDTGRWTLTGYFDGQVVCQKYENGNCIDCMHYPIEEIQFILKRFDRNFIQRYADFMPFLKYKAEQGYWVFEKTGFNQIIFER